MPFVVKEHKPFDPLHVGLFRTDAAVLGSNPLPDLVRKLGLLGLELKGEVNIVIPVCANAGIRHGNTVAKPALSNYGRFRPLLPETTQAMACGARC